MVSLVSCGKHNKLDYFLDRIFDRFIQTRNDETWLRIGDRTKEVKGIDLRNLEYSKNTR